MVDEEDPVETVAHDEVNMLCLIDQVVVGGRAEEAKGDELVGTRMSI